MHEEETNDHRPADLKGKAIILGVVIDNISMVEVLAKAKESFLRGAQIKIFTPNPEICLKTLNDDHYRHILNNSDINIPDGFGLKFGASILGEKLTNRVTGSDLTKELLKMINEQLGKIYVILRDDSLTKKEDLQKIFSNQYPKLKCRVGILKKEDLNNINIVNDINDFDPQVVFCGLGAPYQEKWIDKNCKLMPEVKILLGIGGSFDFITGKIKRAPKILRELGMEWAYRLYQEPKRLGRIKNATADFMLACHAWKKRMATQYRPNVLGVIINKEGKYLVQLNRRLKQWQFPQGGADPGESLEEAVVRECSEELGAPERYFKVIKPFPEKHFYDWQTYSQLLKGYKGQEQSAFLLEFSGEDVDLKYDDSEEVEAIQWVNKDEILSVLHPVRRAFAEKIMKYL